MNSPAITETGGSRFSERTCTNRRETKTGGMSACAIALFLIVGGAGCSRPVPDEIYEPENWQGEIDTSLPADTQAKQDAIIRLFSAIQQVGIERISWDCPDVRFSESFDEFFGNSIGIHRWEWDGVPIDNNLSVRIHFEQDDPTAPKTVEVRTYKVSRSGNGFVVKRVTPDPT